MTTKKKSLMRVGILCLLVCMCISFAACGNWGNNAPTGTEDAGTAYNIEVRSEGGLALSGIGIYVYTDESQTELVAVVKTDKEGKASFTDVAGGSCVAVLSDVPAGYVVETFYKLSGGDNEIVLKAQLLEGDLENVTYQLGDVMQDFTFTASNGNSYKLSELLKTEKAVILNFWYLQCNPCKAEFPYLQEAFTEYSLDIEVLAMNPVDGDDQSITEFANSLNLTFPIGSCDAAWEKAMKLNAYPTTVVIDQYGTIALIHRGSIPDAQTFKDIFAFFTAEDYKQTVVEDIEDLMTEEPVTGTANNPTEIGGQTSFELTVEPGKVHYVDLYKATNLWMEIKNQDIYVEYNGKVYKADGGSVGLLVSSPDTYTPARLGFGNSGGKTQTFTVTLGSLAGSINNPYSMKLGEFTAKVSAGNEQGVYYTYTATEDGTITLQCLSATSGVDYDYSLYNLNSYAMRTLKEDAQTDGDGNKTVSVTMKKGNKLQFSIGTLPSGDQGYPAGTFKLRATFVAGEVEDVEKENVEKQAYAITVTDENRKPIAGVSVAFSSESFSAAAVTNEEGVASAWLPKGTYTARVSVPAGYTANTNQFSLTEKVSMLTMKLDTVIDTSKTYTVTVIDDSNIPVSDVTVSIVGGGYTTTNSAGVATFRLPEGSYTAVVSVPDGYGVSQSSHTFAEGSTHLTIVLTRGGSASVGTDYSVTIQDQAGYPLTGAVVYFQKGDSVVALTPVNANGVAVANLESGDYTVRVEMQNGSAVSYSAADATLSAVKTSTTITVTAKVNTSGLVMDASLGNYYPIYTGSTAVSLKTNERNYISSNNSMSDSLLFAFTPSSAGVYQITVSDSVLTQWNGSAMTGLFRGNNTDEGTVQVQIVSSQFNGDNIPEIFLSVAAKAGVDEAVITVSRVGDVAGELPETIYTPIKAPSAFTLTGAVPNKAVNLKTNHTAVYNSADGYYHLDSANGPVLYVQLVNSVFTEGVATQISFANMLGLGGATGGSSFRGYIYDGDEPVGLEDYLSCMTAYIECADASGFYPLTDDLIHMIKNGGAYKGWWDSEGMGYLFVDNDSNPVPGIINEIGWMFALRYVG